VCAPAAGLTIGADVFAERRGAHAVSEDAILDALRRHFVQWGLPRAIQVDGGVRFLGQSQRTFPSRFELFCAGLGPCAGAVAVASASRSVHGPDQFCQ
jgi:hypothetical protein